MSSLKEKVLSFVRLHGPILPVQINREIGKDSFFSGAILSELVASKEVKMSHAKIGGSRVYYVNGQEEKLSMLFDNLAMREKEAYSLLKEKQVLVDKDTPAAIRVALTMIKDFAVPFTIDKDGKPELLWKWHLLSHEQAVQLIQPKQQKPMQQTIPQPKQTVAPPQPVIQKTETPIVHQPVKKPTPKPIPQKIDFLQDIVSYLRQNNIEVVEEKLIRKNREFDLIVSIPTSVGKLDYVVNAKNKKTLNEADLTLAYQKGQSKKLPVILLTNGELTKKAKLYREKNLKGYVLVKKL